ncbi:hypothetical protein [Silvimonas sp.]|uniref:hypothetical protein n=1 Tax=Silvimonas sp. TaxID=2650811 RepID=UPI00284B7D40|nr:hypothetical protein [Silvimonas sp.]MDR3427780.1 hypothetical protein [Silvimonas sp.]
MPSPPLTNHEMFTTAARAVTALSNRQEGLSRCVDETIAAANRLLERARRAEAVLRELVDHRPGDYLHVDDENMIRDVLAKITK